MGGRRPPAGRNGGARRGSIRIIGGRWRGTRIAVPATSRVRPSSDRVRETLFNWLADALPGARCLDVFAGTGALGFEAVSRGAAAADLIESDSVLAAALERLRVRLDATAISVHRADAFTWLAGAPRAYDVVFIDPPFHAGLVPRALAALARGWLAERALVYLEMEREASFDFDAWRLLEHGRTREVGYALVRHAG